MSCFGGGVEQSTSADIDQAAVEPTAVRRLGKRTSAKVRSSPIAPSSPERLASPTALSRAASPPPAVEQDVHVLVRTAPLLPPVLAHVKFTDNGSMTYGSEASRTAAASADTDSTAAAVGAVTSDAISLTPRGGRPAAGQRPENPDLGGVQSSLSSGSFRQLRSASMMAARAGIEHSRLLLKALKPTQVGTHSQIFTGIFAIVTIGIFMFMAGETNGFAQAARAAAIASGKAPTAPPSTGPNAFGEWQHFWSVSPEYSFSAEYLISWGGRYAPKVAAGESYRWLSSIFLHHSYQHLFSNMIIFLALSLHLERMYGPFRVLALWLAGGFGGNFFSAIFESPCTVVVGASGSIYAMMGLYVASCIVNFESIRYPFVKLLALLLLTGASLLLQFAQSRGGAVVVSGYSHLGGFVSGLCVGYLFLPNFKDNAWRLLQRRAQQKLEKQREQRAKAHATTGVVKPGELPMRLSLSVLDNFIARAVSHSAAKTPTPAESPEGASWWALHPFFYNLVVGTMVVVSLLIFVGFPVIIYRTKYTSDLKC